jgi:hypothetical protein
LPGAWPELVAAATAWKGRYRRQDRLHDRDPARIVIGVVDPRAPQEGRWTADTVSYCAARPIPVRAARRTLDSDRRERFPGLPLPVAQAAYERLVTLLLHAGMSYGDVNVVVALDKIAGASAVE